MNYPLQNLAALRSLYDYTTTDWDHVPSAQAAGKQALKMEAALKLVLLFHSGKPWDSEAKNQWHNLSVDAGVEFPKAATTRGLCDLIREVLGMQAENMREEQAV